MRIGFYAPLKTPDHPVPSGDRQMARALVLALEACGHHVELISRLRSFTPVPEAAGWAELRQAAEAEIGRLAAAWGDPARRPDLLFTYHLYYKAPDLLGPSLAARFARPYVTVEATLSGRREHPPWGERQALVADAVRGAALNICLTARDREGLAATAPPGTLLDLRPFIDTAGFATGDARPSGPVRLVTVAMMRPGDKLDSYRLLGAALLAIAPLAWTLTVVGDGPAREDVRAAFAGLRPERIRWVGAVSPDAVAAYIQEAHVMAWPGFGEAFGVCYLEAQACGVPVVAVRDAGTPSVIRADETGLLTSPAVTSYAAALARLVQDEALRDRLGTAAAAIVRRDHGVEAACRVLAPALAALAEGGGR